MKKSSYVLAAMTLILLGCTLVPVQASDWNFSIGAQYWKPEWSFTYPESGYSPTAEANDFMGPIASIGYKKFNLGVQYFSGTFETDDEIYEMERQDLDVYVTYTFFDHFSALVGYKSLDYEHTYHGQYYTATYTTQLSGLGVGLGFSSYVMDTMFYFRGLGYYMPSLTGDKNYKDADDSYAGDADGDGYSLEATVGYSFELTETMMLNFGVGYKMQKMSISFDEDEYGNKWRDVDDDFKGFKAELTLVF